MTDSSESSTTQKTNIISHERVVHPKEEAVLLLLNQLLFPSGENEDQTNSSVYNYRIRWLHQITLVAVLIGSAIAAIAQGGAWIALIVFALVLGAIVSFLWRK